MTTEAPRKPTPADVTAKVQAEVARRLEQDPIRQYKPGPTQLRCYQSPVLYRMVGGPNQNGKTFHACIEAAGMARGCHPYRRDYGPTKGIILCMSRQQAAEVFTKYLINGSKLKGRADEFPMLPPHEVKRIGWNNVGIRVPVKIELKNGSEIFFYWTGMTDGDTRIAGMQFDWALIDEAAGTQQLLNELMMRLIVAQSDESRPGAGSILWPATGAIVNEAYDDFRTKCMDPKYQDYELFDIQRGENPALSKAMLDRMATSLGEREAQIRIEGKTTRGSDILVYGEQFDVARHVRKDDYLIQPSDNLWISYDPGVDHPSGILCAAISRDAPRKIRCVRFFCERRMTLDYEVQFIVDWLRGRPLEGLVYDPAARKTDKLSHGESVFTQLWKKLTAAGVHVHRGLLQGRNRHKDGIAKTRQYLDPDPFNKNADPLVEMNPGENTGCPRLRYQMMKYRGNEQMAFTGVGGIHKVDDEGPDCLRYLICAMPAYNADTPCGLPNGDAAHFPPVTPDAPILPRVPTTLEEARLERSKGIADRANAKADRMMFARPMGLW